MSAGKAVKLYSYSVILFCIGAVTYIHIPPAFGHQWSTYRIFGDEWVYGSLIIHFFEIPLVLFNVYVSYYGLKKFPTGKKENYVSLLNNAFSTNLVFFTIECVQFFFSFPNSSKTWEKISYLVIVVLMLAAIAFLVYVKQLLARPAKAGTEEEEDGFYHPTTEQEIVYLIKKAVKGKLQIRCKGAAHSLSHAIYAGPATYPNRVSLPGPPDSNDINIMLDCYSKLTWLDEKEGVIEVESGIHLGEDPNNLSGRATFEKGLLFQIDEKGFTLNDLGGIIHQTISGFVMTGSAGGSLKHSLEDNIDGFSIIDGTGNVEWFWKGEDNFYALLTSLGVQGIISKLQLRLTPMFGIKGDEKTVALDANCPIDLFYPVNIFDPSKNNSLEQFLTERDYARLLWWPQPGVERLVIWQAQQAEIPKKRIPYTSFGKKGFGSLFKQLGAGLIFTLLKNKNYFLAWLKFWKSFKAFKIELYDAWGENPLSWIAVWVVTYVLWIILVLVSFILLLLRTLQSKENPWIPRAVIGTFQKITKPGKEKVFHDYPWGSLPMDNEINDTILSTEFTEIWVPMEKGHEAMQYLKELYENNKFDSCGYYATELYASKKSKIWLSPSFRGNALKIDIFWFTNNEGDPSAATSAKDGFFNQFWDGLNQKGIPFCLHWGKFLPGHTVGENDYSNYAKWAAYWRSQYPKWDDFMKLRSQRDPHNIFLTDYWSLHLFGTMR
ncbi:hypothetical protein BH09BAC3_BH09BAC3_12810 [soil metagenome]